MFLILVCLGANATFWLKEVGILNFLPKLLKDFYFVMIRIQKHIVSSTNRLDLLKSLVVFGETNGSLREQVVTPRFKGQTRVRLKCVLGSSLTHMMTHGTETNVTSLLYNKSSVQNI
jgi:hypothetical protein